MPSWIALTGNVAEDSPARIVIEAGTVASVVSLLLRFTSSAAACRRCGYGPGGGGDAGAFEMVLWARATVRAGGCSTLGGDGGVVGFI